jgi:uncharacterized protein YfeS
MLTKFGLKEAAKAGRFAQSKEQKETVFAMLLLMGVPVVIKTQAAKFRKKIIGKISKKLDKIDTLNFKKHEAKTKLHKLEDERDSKDIIEIAWDV